RTKAYKGIVNPKYRKLLPSLSTLTFIHDRLCVGTNTEYNNRSQIKSEIYLNVRFVRSYSMEFSLRRRQSSLAPCLYDFISTLQKLAQLTLADWLIMPVVITTTYCRQKFWRQKFENAI
uniref:Uncharacterized protein n=1 Tax=Glossina palpalis gambiensis TaxID=67801 RepID=A0A1B0B6R4_9MUSC